MVKKLISPNKVHLFLLQLKKTRVYDNRRKTPYSFSCISCTGWAFFYPWLLDTFYVWRGCLSIFEKPIYSLVDWVNEEVGGGEGWIGTSSLSLVLHSRVNDMRVIRSMQQGIWRDHLREHTKLHLNIIPMSKRYRKRRRKYLRTVAKKLPKLDMISYSIKSIKIGQGVSNL